MLQRLAISALAFTLVLTSCAAMPATAAPSRSDGKCPVKTLASDPDCVREGFQYRGSGRLDGDKPQGGLNKSSRDEFPQKRTGTPTTQPNIPPARRGGWVEEDHSNLLAQSDRDQFPTDRRGSGGRPPQAPKA